MNCPCKITFGHLWQLQNLSKTFLSLLRIFVFTRIKVVSIEWQDLVSRQRIDNCSGLHFLRWRLCHPQLSSNWIFCPWNGSLITSVARHPPILVLKHMSQFRSLEKGLWILCFRFCVPTFEESPSEFEIALSQERADTCVSRSSKFSAKGCNQSGLSYVRYPPRESRFLCAKTRLPETCLSGFVCIVFPHACLALQVCIGSDDWFFVLDIEVELLLVDDDNSGTTRNTKLSIIKYLFCHVGSIVEFRRFSTHMNIRVLSTACGAIELLTFLRVIALWTNRSRSWTHTCVSSFVCTSPFAATAVVGVLDLRKVPIPSDL